MMVRTTNGGYGFTRSAVTILFILQTRSETVSHFVSTMLDPVIYDRRERPVPEGGGPTVVEVDMFVASISDINEITMDYSLNIFLRQRWRDSRLAFEDHEQFNSSLTLSYHFSNRLWVPDLFVKNEMNAGEFHEVTVPNVLLNLTPDGDIVYSQRISTRLSCIMDLKKFPLDSQICEVTFESYGYRTDDIILFWRDENPIETKNGMVLPEFNFSKTIAGPCQVQYSTGSFSCIQAKFTLDRLFEFYLIQVYIPSILLVILSWVSFWIDIQAVPARVSLGLLTVLTITTQQSGISAKLPRVSYIKAIDVWMFTCMVFVFGALIEYSAVNVLARRRKMWLDSLKRVWATQENHTKAMQVAALGQLPVLKLAFGTTMLRNQALPKGNAQAETTTNETELNLSEEEMSHIGVKQRFHQNGHACHNQTENGSRTLPESGHESGSRKLTYCEKIQSNGALLVDVISRVAFPTLFTFFNIIYWLYYTQ